MLGRAGCQRRQPRSVVESGPISVWSESRGGTDDIFETDFTDYVLVCDRRVGTVFAAIVTAATGCGGPYAVALRPPFAAIVESQPSTHCSDDTFSLRVIAVPSGKTTVLATWRDYVAPQSVAVTPAGNLLFAGPGTWISGGQARSARTP